MTEKQLEDLKYIDHFKSIQELLFPLQLSGKADVFIDYSGHVNGIGMSIYIPAWQQGIDASFYRASTIYDIDKDVQDLKKFIHENF